MFMVERRHLHAKNVVTPTCTRNASWSTTRILILPQIVICTLILEEFRWIMCIALFIALVEHIIPTTYYIVCY